MGGLNGEIGTQASGVGKMKINGGKDGRTNLRQNQVLVRTS